MGLGSWVKRGVVAVGTGGLSELGGARTINDLSGGKLDGVAKQTGLEKPDTNEDAQRAEIEENDRRRQEFAKQLAEYQSRQAPHQQGISLGPAAQTAIPEHLFAEKAGAPDQFFSATANGGKVASTTVGPASTYKAANIGDAHTASAGLVDATGGFRNDQTQAIKTLQAAADGKAPSAAQEGLKQATAKNIAAQMALRSSARGSGVGRAERAAADAVERTNQDAAGQASELQANEQAAARAQLGGALQGFRGQDIQAQGINANNLTDVSKLNASQANQHGIEQGRLEQQSRSEGAGAQNAVNLEQGRITAGERSQQAGIDTDISKFNAGNENDINKFLTGLKQQGRQFDAGAQNDLNKYGLGLSTQVGLANTGATNQRTSEQGQMDFNVGHGNQLADIDFTKMDDEQKRALMNFILGSSGQSITGQGQIGEEELKASGQQHQNLQDSASFLSNLFIPKGK